MFELLRDTKSDIANSRLVRRSPEKRSSAFLITRTVYGRRLKDLEKLYQVLEYPYLREHMTELLYDASRYRWSNLDHDEYMESTRQGTKYRTFSDEDWCRRRETDALSVKRFLEDTDAAPGSNSKVQPGNYLLNPMISSGPVVDNESEDN